jgi:hypothetical protein
MINNNKQYEGTNLTEKNKKELLRALFDSYKNRLETRMGIGSLETVMNDRLMSFKTLTKKELELNIPTAFFSLVIGFFLYINIIDININFFFLLAMILGFFISNFKIFLLKNISPIKNKIHEIAFKKVMYDVYFETFTSVHIVYYVYGLCLFFLYLGLNLFLDVQTFYYIDLGIFKIAMKFNLVAFNFFNFLNDILISFFLYLIGSYMYLYTYIFLEIKKIMKISEIKNDNE